MNILLIRKNLSQFLKINDVFNLNNSNILIDNLNKILIKINFFPFFFSILYTSKFDLKILLILELLAPPDFIETIYLL